MILTWISTIFHQKALVFMSITSVVMSYLPARLHPHLEDIFFVIVGWVIAMILTFVEYMTGTARTKSSKNRARMEFFSKIIVYTLVFFVLKFFHLWIVFEDHAYIGAVINVLVISSYALVSLGEFKFIGQNLEKRYGKKPRVFEHLDGVEQWILKNIVKKAEKVCHLDEDEK